MERERLLAAHNLHACFAELQTVKQAILDGRLWELLETRARNHPALQIAFQRMLHYSDRFEPETPIRKRKGPFILTEQSLFRPEVIRHQARLLQRYRPPPKAKKLLLIPEEHTRSFRESASPTKPVDRLERINGVHLCSYSLTYGIVPYELIDVYPLSQTETSLAPTPAAISFARRRVADYIKKFGYSRCIIIGSAPWHEELAERLKQKSMGKVKIRFLEEKELDKQALQRILKTLK
jgi:7-cyano-7-deazaguanine tRNA-ribosyltransferase